MLQFEQKIILDAIIDSRNKKFFWFLYLVELFRSNPHKFERFVNQSDRTNIEIFKRFIILKRVSFPNLYFDDIVTCIKR